MKISLIQLGCAALLAAAGAAQAAPIQWSGNGHYYEYVSTPTTWDGAVAAAAAKTHLGMAGYLVTITSQQEMNFIYSNLSFSDLAWLGGSDAETEGVWKWMTGPEAGQVFYQVGASVQPGYSMWNYGEPNNEGNEDFLHLYPSYAYTAWNDMVNGSAGYIVEYSANPVPEPGSLALLGVAGVAGALTRRRKRG